MKPLLQIITLTTLLYSGHALAQVNLSSRGVVTENFDALGTAGGAWTDNATLQGWYAAYSNSTAGVTLHTAYEVSPGGASSSSKLYAFGSDGSSERGLGAPAANATWCMLGLRILNSGSVAITNLTLIYDGEQWRRDGTASSRISVTYQQFAAGAGSLAVAGGWLAAPASLTFNSVTTGTAGNLNGNSPTNRSLWLTATLTGLNIPAGDEIWFKWTFTKNGGNNLGQAVDNVRVAANLGAPPTIGPIPGITVLSGQASTNANFTVADPEDGAPAAAATVVSSSDETVVSAANVVLSGTGANRSVNVSQAGNAGTAYVTIEVQDSAGNPVQRAFPIIVLPLNYAPVISAIPATNTLAGVPVSVPFTVSDAETPASALNVTAEIASWSTHLLQSVSLTSDASGTNRSALITPVPGTNGVGALTVTVADPEGNTNSRSFGVMVRPSGSIVFIDNFDYPANASVRTASGDLWLLCNAASSTYQLREANETGVEGKLYIRGYGSADDCAARLAGAPYAPGSGSVLYSVFRGEWIDFGVSDFWPTNDTTHGAFLRLLNTPTTTSAAVAEMAVATNGLSAPEFKVGLMDSSAAFVPFSSATLACPSGPVLLVARYDVDEGKSLLWVNPTSEASSSVSSVDDLTPGDISYLQVRQEVGMGLMYVDTLQVMAVRKPSITRIEPSSPGSLNIFFTADPYQTYGPADFAVVGTTDLSSGFSQVSASIASLGGTEWKATLTGVSGSRTFYRVRVSKLLSF